MISEKNCLPWSKSPSLSFFLLSGCSYGSLASVFQWKCEYPDPEWGGGSGALASAELPSYFLTENWGFPPQGISTCMCISHQVLSSQGSSGSTYLVVEEKQSAEQAVQICCEQGEVDWSGTGLLYDDWHEAVEAKHAGAKANVEQSCGEREEGWWTASSGGLWGPQHRGEGDWLVLFTTTQRVLLHSASGFYCWVIGR